MSNFYVHPNLSKAYESGKSGQSVFGQGYTSTFEYLAHGDGQADRANTPTPSSFSTPPPISLSSPSSFSGGGGFSGSTSSGSGGIGGFIGFIVVIGILAAVFGGGTKENRGSVTNATASSNSQAAQMGVVTYPYATVNTTNLNLRTGPGTDYPIVAIMPQNTRAYVMSQSANGWMELGGVISVEGRSLHGFANATYLTLNKSR
jgi:hypothetical protein